MWIVNLDSKLLLPKVQVLQLLPLVELGGGGKNEKYLIRKNCARSVTSNLKLKTSGHKRFASKRVRLCFMNLKYDSHD